MAVGSKLALLISSRGRVDGCVAPASEQGADEPLGFDPKRKVAPDRPQHYHWVDVPIPDFDSDGDLPVGEHTATWAEVVARYRTTPRRQVLADGLLSALLELTGAGCRQALLDGSFATAKAHPGDFDLCYDPTFMDPAKLDPVFFDFDNGRAAQKAKFGGECFPWGYAAALNPPIDYRRFFQQRHGKPVGIVRFDLTRFP